MCIRFLSGLHVRRGSHSMSSIDVVTSMGRCSGLVNERPEALDGNCNT